MHITKLVFHLNNLLLFSVSTADLHLSHMWDLIIDGCVSKNFE